MYKISRNAGVGCLRGKVKGIEKSFTLKHALLTLTIAKKFKYR
jgi:hypothetical protein